MVKLLLIRVTTVIQIPSLVTRCVNQAFTEGRHVDEWTDERSADGGPHPRNVNRLDWRFSKLIVDGGWLTVTFFYRSFTPEKTARFECHLQLYLHVGSFILGGVLPTFLSASCGIFLTKSLKCT